MSDIKRNLDQILGELPSLQNLDDYTPSIEQTEGGEVIYDEFITHDMAKVILGNRYAPNCQYKLITQSNITVLCKINHAWPSDRPPVTDQEGHIIDGAIVEYVLNEDKQRDVLSYTDMMLNIDRTKQNPTGQKTYYGFNEHPKRRFWIWACIGSAAIVIALWVAAMLFLSTLKGGF